MGGLPDGWAWARLKDLGDWFGGGTPSKKEPDYWEGGDVPWLSPKDMKSERLADVQDRITERAVNESSVRMVPRNSVAIVTRSGVLEHSVPVALVPFATTLNQDVKAVVAHSGVLPEWIAWALRRYERKILGECRKAGTTVASLSTPALMGMRVPVPPLAEQHRIVEALEEQFSRLDAAARSVEATTRRAEALGKLLDSRAVADPDSRSEFPLPLTVGEVRSSTIGSADRKWKPTDPINIPGFVGSSRWPTVSLGDLAVGRGYGTSAKCSYEGAGTPVLRIPNVQNGVVDPEDMKFAEDSTMDLSDYFVRSGDVLFVRTNGSPSLIGRVGVVEEDANVAFASYLIRFRLNLKVVDPRWVRLVTQSKIWRRHLERVAASSAGQLNLNSSRLAELPIPLPSLDEQRSIVERAESQSEEVQRVKDVLRRSDRHAHQLRVSLLRKAFEGRLTDQDPNDEPATTLLARIAAERNTAKPARTTKRAARPRKGVAEIKATESAAPGPTPAPITTVQQELFQ